MLDRLQDYLKRKIGQPKAYYITCAVYLTLTIGGILLVGLLFNLMWQMILIGILISFIRAYSMGFHCNDNIRCFIISSIVLVMFGCLSTNMPMWAVMLICLFCCRDIYIKSPIELNEELLLKGKDKDWHFKRVVLIMTIYLVISLVFYLLEFYELSKCFMLSLVLTDLFLFKNDKEYI